MVEKNDHSTFSGARTIIQKDKRMPAPGKPSSTFFNLINNSGLQAGEIRILKHHSGARTIIQRDTHVPAPENF